VTRVEIREGREFIVTTLPEVFPPKNRSRKTRYKLEDVGKAGDVSSRRKKKREARQ
jgi:hypothetical protein